MKKLLLILYCIPLLVFGQKDYVSNIKWDEVLFSEISLDFEPVGITSEEYWKHFEHCKENKHSMYSADSIWQTEHLNTLIKDLKAPENAFINVVNLKNHPLKTWNGADYVMQAYIPTDDGYQYYTRLGFAFTDLGITTDFNKDGILDRKIKFTLLDYEKSHHTVKYMTYNDNGTFRENLIEKECMEYSGYAYITRYSNNGILHLIFSYESSEMWNFK